jgi:hypothetical protein
VVLFPPRPFLRVALRVVRVVGTKKTMLTLLQSADSVSSMWVRLRRRLHRQRGGDRRSVSDLQTNLLARELRALLLWSQDSGLWSSPDWSRKNNHHVRVLILSGTRLCVGLGAGVCVQVRAPTRSDQDCVQCEYECKSATCTIKRHKYAMDVCSWHHDGQD